MQIIVIHEDSDDFTDVTEAVQVIYDAMHAYMGMASGSLDSDEWDAVLRLAEAAAFTNYEDLKAQRAAEERAEAERREKRLAWEAERAAASERGRQQALRLLEEQARVVAQMRAAEPHLADYPDGSLWTLHLMRQQGTA